MENKQAGQAENREIRHAEKSFIESVLDNMLLGGFMVTGLIMLTQKYVPQDYTDAVAVIFIMFPLLAWAYRFYMAEKRRDIGL
jgi:hypothetical protein